MPYFGTLAGKTSLSLRGSQEVGMDVPCGIYSIRDMLAPGFLILTPSYPSGRP